MNYALLIASISLIISVFFGYLEINRRWSKLFFAVHNVEAISGSENKVFLVAYLTFVNNSTIPKVIYHLKSELLENYQISVVSGEPDSELSTRIFRAFDNGHRGFRARFDDIASFPLDIEPLHSKTVIFPVIISPVPPLPPDTSKVDMKLIGYFVALDHRNKILAKAPIRLPL